ncbi:MAG: efflux RND transporter periplasmic adaptor subunit [Candidatus Omnitrophota bacterium]
MSKKTISSLGGILIFIAVFVLSGCQPKKEAVVEKETIPVKIIRVELQGIKNTLDYAGDIKALDEAKVYPKVNGKIIEKVLDEGSSVKKGDVIVYVDRDEVGFKFEKAPVESPLTGTIGRVYVDIGTNVTIQDPVALVVNMDKVRVDLDIPEEYLPKVNLGQSAEMSLQAYPDEKFTGTVSKVSPVLDLETRTAPIEITISNSDHRLKSGMFVQVQLVLEEHENAVVIPKEAIMGKEPQAYVYIIRDNIACQKSIKTGVRQGAYCEVVDGLKDGDMVVVMGQQQLYEGALVLIGQ